MRVCDFALKMNGCAFATLRSKWSAFAIVSCELDNELEKVLEKLRELDDQNDCNAGK